MVREETIFNYLLRQLRYKILTDKNGEEYIRGNPSGDNLFFLNVRTGASEKYTTLEELRGLKISGEIDEERREKILEKLTKKL